MFGQHPKLNNSCSFAAKLAMIAMMMSASATAIAGPTIPGPKWQSADEATDAEVAYVDSVKSWGAWELDIEPAAGGLTPPSTQALNPRNSKVALRTNSISALAPPTQPAPATINSPVPTPPIPYSGPAAPTTFAPSGATPVTTYSPPPSPNVIPVSPTTTIPSGNGSLF